MNRSDRVTNDTNEIAFADILAGDNIITLPLFQREYVWTKKQFEHFKEDVAAVIEEEDGTRFLGAIVAIDHPVTPGKPKPFELVDGQQRLTTIYLTILAAADVAASSGEAIFARDIIQTHLLLRDLPGETTNTKLIPSFDDRLQFDRIWKRVLRNQKLREALGEQQPKQPSPSGHETGRMFKQYGNAYGWLKEQWEAGGLPAVELIVKVVAGKLSFVWVTLNAPGVAPKIFKSLNARGVRTTIGALVRNEVFARLTDQPELARKIYESEWKPFQAHFGDAFEGFFFPFCLISNASIRKAELFDELRKRWAKFTDASEIITDMDAYREPYLAIDQAIRPEDLSEDLWIRIIRFNAMDRPASLYPFVMRVLKAASEPGAPIEQYGEALDVIESFLVRRALAGIEPTGLHAVFKGLWDEVKGVVNAATVTEKISARGTVPWPTDNEFRASVLTGPLARRNMRYYVLLEYEHALGGDSPSNRPQIEHILPQVMTEGWRKIFTDEQHKALVDTWANLVPLSGEMNRRISQGPFAAKSREFRDDSMFDTARRVGREYTEWTPATLGARAGLLGDWAIKRWPYGKRS